MIPKNQFLSRTNINPTSPFDPNLIKEQVQIILQNIKDSFDQLAQGINTQFTQNTFLVLAITVAATLTPQATVFIVEATRKSRYERHLAKVNNIVSIIIKTERQNDSAIDGTENLSFIPIDQLRKELFIESKALEKHLKSLDQPPFIVQLLGIFKYPLQAKYKTQLLIHTLGSGLIAFTASSMATIEVMFMFGLDIRKQYHSPYEYTFFGIVFLTLFLSTWVIIVLTVIINEYRYIRNRGEHSVTWKGKG